MAVDVVLQKLGQTNGVKTDIVLSVAPQFLRQAEKVMEINGYAIISRGRRIMRADKRKQVSNERKT